MENLKEGLLFGFGLQLIAQFVQGLTIPITLLIAAGIVWSSTSKWIPMLLLVSAGMLVLHWVPRLLLYPLRTLSHQGYSDLVIPMFLTYWVGTIALLCALLGMSVKLKRNAEQRN